MPLWGAIEAGGTKFNLAVGTTPHDIQHELRIPTTSPEETLGRAVAFFKEYGPIDGLGLGCFGPLDITAGTIVNTPKPGWQGFPVVEHLRSALGVPIAFDTDVNAAALAEGRWGAAQGFAHHVYVTIGTGIGGGVIVRDQPLHGLLHPELGHMRIKRHSDDLDFDGICPFHDDCLEGLASGPAMKSRTGVAAENLDINDIAWDIEADCLAQMCHNLCLTLSPECIVLGGGVMAKPGLLEKVQARFVEVMSSYVDVINKAGGVEKFIRVSALDGKAGLYGAFALIIAK